MNIGDVGDTAKLCLLKTSVEIFDVQTGMTFVSVPGESIGGNSERDASVSSVLRTERKYVSGRKILRLSQPPQCLREVRYRQKFRQLF